MSAKTLVERPCLFGDGDNKFRGIFHGFVTEAWVRGASYSIGGPPAGQERHTYALIENESGRLLMLPPREVTLLDSEKLFNAYAWDKKSDENKKPGHAPIQPITVGTGWPFRQR